MVGLAVLAVVIGGVVAAAYYVDKMAVAYLTGQRRVPGKDWWGRDIDMEGRPPGYVFLGFSQPSEEPLGFRITRPTDAGVKAGLKAGDIVTSVNGKSYIRSFDLISDLLSKHKAGEVLPVTVIRGEEELKLELELQTFYRSPGDLDLAYEEVEIPSASGHLLKGWYIPPAEKGDGRVAIFVHGANSSRFQALDGAPYWHQRGYGLLTMDLSGRGTSEGDYVTYTINEREDVRSMVAAMKSRADVSPEKIVVFGTSNGAAASIYASAEGLNVASLVLDAPYSDLWVEAGEMLSARGGHSALRHLLGIAVKLRAGVDLRTVRPVEAIGGFQGPVLFIHGDADTQVLPYHSERMHQLRLESGLPSRRMVIEGGEHGFDNYPPPEEFWGEVLDFCDQYVNGEDQPSDLQAHRTEN
jgi:dipeptidyl aminopeptidase/acylaminoacyl peptidase